MSKREVSKFNHLCNNGPSMGTDFEVWQQIKNQAKRIYEEAKELMEAATFEDMQGVVDGWADVMYTNEYMDDLLKSVGVDTKGVWACVCDNNNSKFTTSYFYAFESKEVLEQAGVECYIENVVYEGETYYCVKDVTENKVRKLRLHQAPIIEQYIPEEWCCE